MPEFSPLEELAPVGDKLWIKRGFLVFSVCGSERSGEKEG